MDLTNKNMEVKEGQFCEDKIELKRSLGSQQKCLYIRKIKNL